LDGRRGDAFGVQIVGIGLDDYDSRPPHGLYAIGKAGRGFEGGHDAGGIVGLRGGLGGFH
jgi:hypothetical protein